MLSLWEARARILSETRLDEWWLRFHELNVKSMGVYKSLWEAIMLRNSQNFGNFLFITQFFIRLQIRLDNISLFISKGSIATMWLVLMYWEFMDLKIQVYFAKRMKVYGNFKFSILRFKVLRFRIQRVTLRDWTWLGLRDEWLPEWWIEMILT